MEQKTMAFDRKLFFYLSAAFILATIAGTVSHECGHYLIAKKLGYLARISYNYTSWNVLGSHENFNRDIFYITLGGPLQTMLTGTLGLCLLFIFKRSYTNSQRLTTSRWSIVLLALFWLRQPANFAIWLAQYFFTGKFSQQADEVQLALYLRLQPYLIMSITALLGLLVFSIVFFYFIPRQQRLTFILAGLTGGIVGFVVWMKVLGPVILPE